MTLYRALHNNSTGDVTDLPELYKVLVLQSPRSLKGTTVGVTGPPEH